MVQNCARACTLAHDGHQFVCMSLHTHTHSIYVYNVRVQKGSTLNPSGPRWQVNIPYPVPLYIACDIAVHLASFQFSFHPFSPCPPSILSSLYTYVSSSAPLCTSSVYADSSAACLFRTGTSNNNGYRDIYVCIICVYKYTIVCIHI